MAAIRPVEISVGAVPHRSGTEPVTIVRADGSVHDWISRPSVWLAFRAQIQRGVVLRSYPYIEMIFRSV